MANSTFNDGTWNDGDSGTAAVAGVLISDLIRSAFRLISRLGAGFTYAPSEGVDALFILNAMLDSWSLDSLISGYARLTQSFTLGQTQPTDGYTIGTGGDFDAGRPVKLLDAKYIVMTNASQPLHLPLDILNSDQFEAIHLPDTTSTIPTRLFYNPTYPLGTIKLWPEPTVTSDKLLLSWWQTITGNITDQNAIFSVPPGYLDAVRYNLAIRLALEMDKPVKPGVPQLAVESLARIQNANAETPQMTCNPGVMPYGSGLWGFNILTGE
jgi:hypothetical protein